MLLTENYLRNYSGFSGCYMVFMNYMKNSHENEPIQDQKFHMNVHPHHPFYLIPLSKRKEEFFAKQKSLRVLKFLRVLFRFHSDRVLLMDFSGRVLLIVLSDGVLFESLVIGSSSLTNRFFSWVISALFPAYRFFYQNVLLLFDLKQMFCLHYIFKHKFTLNNQ